MKNNKAVYGIIGFPVKHSLSPLMHNAAFKALGVGAVYRTFELKVDELDAFFAEVKSPANPIFGLNVTVPYKESVIKYLDSLSPLVQKIGAVNTIVINHDRKLVGYNTDAPGFLAHLAELKFTTTNKRIAILGAGGSARAIIASLCLLPERPKAIKVYNRTTLRAQVLLTDLKSQLDTSIVQLVNSIDDLEIPQADLLINTTSIGLKEDDECPIEQELLHKGMLVYDLIYNPARTQLLKLAKKVGAKTANGIGMLYYQGVLSLQHWAGMPIDEKIKLIMREELEEGSNK